MNSNYSKSLLKKLKNQSFNIFNYLFQPFEKYYMRKVGINILENSPPVFLIGPPRSGTTILYQLLCRHFNFGYINNFVSNWHRVPLTATKFYKLFFPKNNIIDLESHYGRSNFLSGPNEFGEFWYNWFNRKHYDKTALNSSEIIEIRRTVAGLTNLHQNSMIFKNVVNSVRIIKLKSIFKNCIFIVMNRDYLDIAQSILNSREKIYGDKNQWWSVMTTDYLDMLNKPFWIQIHNQILGVYSHIQRARIELGSEHFLFIDYKNLCLNTSNELGSLYNQLMKLGVNISSNGDFPNSLDYSTGQKVTNKDFDNLKNVFGI